MADDDDAEAFMAAPVPLWVFDLSELRLLLALWREQGVTDPAALLRENPRTLGDCVAACRFVKANLRAAALFDLGSSPMAQAQAGASDWPFVQLVGQLWRGQTQLSGQATLPGARGGELLIRWEGKILPGHQASWSRVIYSATEISGQQEAPRLVFDDIRARGLFEQSPVSLWVEDYSELKSIFEALRRQGVTDLRKFIAAQPGFVEQAMRAIQIIDVNARTLSLFAAPDKATLLGGLDTILGTGTRGPFIDELADLWHGNLTQHREVVNHAMNGERLDLVLQLSIMPGFEHDWSCVLIGLTDITARKRAETALEYMASHDILSKLHNRAFFEREIERLDATGPFPVSAMIADLNGLKTINDVLGHAAGDNLIARIGGVLLEAVGQQSCAARIGGDEFAILMPGTDEKRGIQTRDKIHDLIRRENEGNRVSPMSLSIGLATCRRSGELEKMLRVADRRMYEAKREHYAAVAEDRRTVV
jgi:diguanylate cyclase (GGDEF)-like protein